MGKEGCSAFDTLDWFFEHLKHSTDIGNSLWPTHPEWHIWQLGKDGEIRRGGVYTESAHRLDPIQQIAWLHGIRPIWHNNYSPQNIQESLGFNKQDATDLWLVCIGNRFNERQEELYQRLLKACDLSGSQSI